MSHTTDEAPLPVPPYVGNGPYCYTNSLLTVLGGEAPTPGIVETLTSSAFGFQLLAGRLPLFDPYGWNPDHGLDQALRLLGYSWQRVTSDSATQALTALRDRVREGPVLIGPVDMGLLAHNRAAIAPPGPTTSSWHSTSPPATWSSTIRRATPGLACRTTSSARPGGLRTSGTPRAGTPCASPSSGSSPSASHTH